MSTANQSARERAPTLNEAQPSPSPPPSEDHSKPEHTDHAGPPYGEVFLSARLPSSGPLDKATQAVTDHDARPATADLGNQRQSFNLGQEVENKLQKEPPPPMVHTIHQPHPYITPPAPDEVGDFDDLWKKANKVADSIVQDQTKAMNGSLDTTLIFAGLFSAVNSTLLSISLPSLSPNLQEESNHLLRLLVTNNGTLPQSLPFKPSPRAVRDNILFATSLLFSLFAAFGAVLGKQWLIYYTNVTPGISDKKEAEERQAKIEGAMTWHLQLLLEMLLPSVLQISLGLFIVGMIDFLWSIHPSLGIWNGSLAGLASVLFFGTLTVAILYPRSPFQSPLPKFVWPAIHQTVPRELPFWLTRNPPPANLRKAPKKVHPLGIRNETRRWLNFDSWYWKYVTIYNPAPPTSSEDLVCQSVIFTLKHTDDLAASLAAAKAIPTITSREKVQRLAKYVTVSLLGLFTQSLARLRQEAITGSDSDTLTSAALLSRAVLHLYISGTRNSSLGDNEWWIDIVYEHLADYPSSSIMELAHLRTIGITWRTGEPVISPPPTVYMAAALMRYVEYVKAANGSWRRRDLKRTFREMAVSALGQPCQGSTIAFCANALRYIIVFVHPLDVDLLDDTILCKRLQTRRAQTLQNNKEFIWRLYKRYLLMSREVTSYWEPSVRSLFETWLEETQHCLGDESPTLWTSFLDKLSPDAAGEESDYSEAQVFEILSTLLRRLDMRRLVCQGKETPAKVKPLLDYVHMKLNVGMQKMTETQREAACRSLVKRAAGVLGSHPEIYCPLFVTKLTYFVMEEKYSMIDILSQGRDIIEAIGIAINRPDDAVPWAILWALVHQAQLWFDHANENLHSRFIDAGIASGIVAVLARTLARIVRQDILEEAKPLLVVLTKRPCWIIPLVDAFKTDAIVESLERGSALVPPPRVDRVAWEPIEDTWDTDERDLRTEIARLISEAGIAFMLQQWHKARRSQTDEETSSGAVVDDVWFGHGVVKAVILYLQTEHHQTHHQELDVVLHAYAEDLQGLGRERTDCSDDLKEQMDNWDSKNYGMRLSN